MNDLERIQEAMKDVLQEIVIILPDGSHHIVYIHNISYDDKLIYDFSTPSEDIKDELIPHIEKCLQGQIDQVRYG